MDAKGRFDATLDRCSALVSLYAENQNEDLLRSAAVLAVSAFDMFAADRFSEYFVQHVKSHEPTEKDDKFLCGIGFTLHDALVMIKETRRRPFRRIRKILDEHLEHKSMQAFKNINELYAYYGLKDIVTMAAKKAKSKTLVAKVEKLIKRRHAIVHACDYNGKNALQRMQKPEVENQIEALRVLVSNMDDIIRNKFSPKKPK